jgi:hypothetical protein
LQGVVSLKLPEGRFGSLRQVRQVPADSLHQSSESAGRRDKGAPELGGTSRVGDRQIYQAANHSQKEYGGVPEMNEHLPGQEADPVHGDICGLDVGVG